jgi:hypothetical protein
MAEALQTATFRGHFPIGAHPDLAGSFSFQFLLSMVRAACAAGFHFSVTGCDKKATVCNFTPAIPSFVAKKQQIESFRDRGNFSSVRAFLCRGGRLSFPS